MALRINIPPLTRVLLVLLVGFSLLCQVASYRSRKITNGNEATIVPWIALTPQISVYYPWVYLTSTFAEQNLITLLISGTTILYGGKYLERAWGSAELAKFLLIVTLIPNLIAAFLYIAAFAVSRSAALSYVSTLSLSPSPILTSSQFNIYPRFHIHPSCFLSRLQATCPRAHCHYSQGCHQDPRQTFPRYIHRREYDIWLRLFHRHRGHFMLAWLPDELDISPIL